MASETRQDITLAILRQLPPVLANGLLNSREFRDKHEIKIDPVTRLGDSGPSFRRSLILAAIRSLYESEASTPELTSEDGTIYKLLFEQGDSLSIMLDDGLNRLKIPSFFFLSSDASVRLAGFDAEAKQRFLADPVVLSWRERLARGPLQDHEVDEFQHELGLNPLEVASAIRAEIPGGKSKTSSLVPTSASYYIRLVGNPEKNNTLFSFIENTAARRLADLVAWESVEGLKLGLLMASHSSVTAQIDADSLKTHELVAVFEWLVSYGDRFSQVAGVELGLRTLGNTSELEPYIAALVSTLLDDDPSKPDSRARLTAGLVRLVYGETARRGVLRDEPPFWRRMAAIAQASLIEREIVASGVDLDGISNWAQQYDRVFDLQCLIDLRLEPRWLPEFMTGVQLKAEFLGRLVGASEEHADTIRSQELRRLLLDEAPTGLRSQVDLSAFLPGPLEGAIASRQDLPEEQVEKLKQTADTGHLHEDTLIGIANSAFIFRLRAEHVQLLADTIRAANYRVLVDADDEKVISILLGLAYVAAATRSIELAEEVRVLARAMRRRPGVAIRADSLMRVGTIAAAAEADVEKWANFLGDWLTEVSLEKLDPNTATAMQEHVSEICKLEPRLWKSCAKAEAAFAAASALVSHNVVPAAKAE